jgi:hypothetical protein
LLRVASMTNFQRKGAISNTHVGREFEEAAHRFFEQKGIPLQPGFSVPIGHRVKKPHKFDLGSERPPILVECKSFTWTEGGNVPSAKIRGMNEAMLHFSVAPPRYRKILFILRDMHKGRSLGSYYVKTQGHLIPKGVEVWEFDFDSNVGSQIS